MNRKTVSFAVFTWILGFCLMVSLPLHAQVAGATLSGTVMDQSGGVVPQVAITVKNIATGITRNSTTSAAGFYSAPNLLPGTYEIRAAAQGFSSQVQTGIKLTVGEQQILNFTLQVGQMTQTVEVTTEAPNVELASSAISAVVGATTVVELPLNGRSWTDLATLQPGVNALSILQPTFEVGTDRGNRGFGAQLSISGGRPQENNYRLDGVSINDYGNGGPGSVLGGNLGVDSIQEFSVLTSNYSAEYGKTSGGVVNAITRSGTNQFHGSVYEFLRNDALDAANFFDNATNLKKPPFRNNQFGASGGGPIRKDRTFIFGDFEGLRRSKGRTFTNSVPSPNARLGILADPNNPGQNLPAFTGNCPTNPFTGTITSKQLDPKASVCVDDAAAKFLPLYHLPNAGVINGDLGTFAFVGQQVANENFVTTRGDHHFSEKDSLFGTYLYDDTSYRYPDRFDVQEIGSHTRRQFVALEESHTFTPTLVNAVRVGYNRAGVANQQPLFAINDLAKDVSLGSVPGKVAADVRIGSGIPEFLGGLGSANVYYYFWNSFQGYDDAFLTHGTHSLKFGVGVERMQLNYLANTTPGGTWGFANLANFLTNKPRSFASALPGRLTPRGLRQTLFGAYFQDDWRWRPNLTLNLGLRYEMVTVPTEAQGKLVNLLNVNDPLPHCANITFFPGECDPTALPSFFLNPTLRNFEPRVGFAWDPFHNGKTAVRGGFGVFDMLPLTYQFNLTQTAAAPFYQLGNVQSKALAGTFLTGAFGLLGNSSLRGTYVEHSPHRSYVMQWNTNIQRELLPNLTASVGYVGSRGVHLPFRVDDANMVIPTKTPAGYLWPQVDVDGNIPTSGLPPDPINTKFGRTNATLYMGNSYYHALELQLANRMSHGLQVQGAYTWSKSIDNNSATIAGDQFGNGIATLDWFDGGRSRGVSDFNIGRTLVINAIWQVPGLKSASGPATWVLNGWQLGAIYKASDGAPFTPTISTDGDPLAKLNDSPFDYANRIAGCNPINRNFKSGNLLYVNPKCFAIPTAPSPAFFDAAAPLGCDTSTDASFGGQSTDPTKPKYLWCFNLGGNPGRNSLVGPGISELDFSVFKNNNIKRISETFNVQFRVEFFNILNHANFAVPVTPDNTDMLDLSGTVLTRVAGLLTSTSTDPREIQFALKLTW
jgi:hypothetical protein